MKTLREWRKERLMSLDDLAAAAGVSNKTIVQVELGRQLPRYRTMRRLCAALKVQPADVTEFVAALQEGAQGEEEAA
jgi:transcriptional regulator with XRE-family HTH domain